MTPSISELRAAMREGRADYAMLLEAMPTLLALARAVGELETTRTSLAAARAALQRATDDARPAWPANPNWLVDEAHHFVAEFERRLYACQAVHDAARAAVTL